MTEEAEAQAKKLDVMSVETSAKAGMNIKTLFRKITQNLPGVEGLSQAPKIVDNNFNLSQS